MGADWPLKIRTITNTGLWKRDMGWARVWVCEQDGMARRFALRIQMQKSYFWESPVYFTSFPSAYFNKVFSSICVLFHPYSQFVSPLFFSYLYNLHDTQPSSFCTYYVA